MPRATASLLRREAAEPGPSLRQVWSRDWARAFADVRAETERRASFLAPEDQVIQSMPDASPIKWHRAHTTWFFEQFLLKPFAKGYQPYDERFAFLFNSYYVAAGPRHARPERGLITRPNAEEVAAYRWHVDAAVADLIAGSKGQTLAAIVPIIEIGLHHEQQHQELMLTDILHAFSMNPTNPAYDPKWEPPLAQSDNEWAELPQGIHHIGHHGDSFCFDNEMPRHQTLLRQGLIACGLVTNGEWLEFMADNGYTTPSLWLSDGWAKAKSEAWDAPGYWRNVDGAWFTLTLGGLKPVDPGDPGHRQLAALFRRPLRRNGLDLGRGFPLDGRARSAARGRRAELHRSPHPQRAPRAHGSLERLVREALQLPPDQVLQHRGQTHRTHVARADLAVRKDPHPHQRVPRRQVADRGVPARLQGRGHPARGAGRPRHLRQR